MNVSLTPELEGAVQSFVDRGLYSSQSEVVRAALRLLLEREQEREAKLAALKGEIRLGLQDIREGRVGSYSVEELKTEGRRKLRDIQDSEN